MSPKAQTNIIHVSFRKDVVVESEAYEFIRSEARKNGMTIKGFLCELVKTYKGGSSTTFSKAEIEEIIKKTVKEAGSSTIDF